MALQQVTQKFPRIFRFITERVPASHLSAAKIALSCLLSFLLIGAIASQSLVLSKNLKELEEIAQVRQGIQNEISYWKKASKDHKDYSDIYLKIASLEYRLGNMKDSVVFLEKALSINPDTEQGRVLGGYISR